MRTQSIHRKTPVRVFWSMLLLLGLTAAAWGQSFEERFGLAKTSNVAVPANGSGVMVAGELWDSFLPPNAGPYYSEATQPIIGTMMRIGNYDRAWTTPTHMWPGGWTNGQFWGKGFYLTEYNPDSTWNPPTIASATNPSFRTGGGRYAFGAFKSTVLGASNTARNYKNETQWVDATKRHHALYTAGWPTTIGVDVKVKIHQYSLNWNNFNDFIIVEVTLVNTGILDMNADGIADSAQTGRAASSSNTIRALTMLAHGEYMCTYALGVDGGRANRFGAQRAIGYIGDNDPKGFPWDITVGYPGESATSVRDMGLNDFPLRFYTDVWSGWSWLGVKRGESGTNTSTLPDKNTIYGTNSVGTGVERGWYASSGQGRGLGVGAGGNLSDPMNIHTAAMGTYYVDGGKNRSTTFVNRAPNSKFFLSGTTGDPTTFVVKPWAISTPADSTRPNGDRKLLSQEVTTALEVNTWEAGYTKGYSAQDNFDGDLFSAVGPISMAQGDTVTIVWAEVSGYRLAGITNAMAAARWVYENGYSLGVAEPPATPEMRIDNTLNKTVRVRWDNRANSSPNFGGYKIYKASQAKQVDWLATGTRGMDEYWRNTTAGPTPAGLLKPINPNFTAQSFVAGRNGVPDSWGPFELVRVIPSAQLGTYVDASAVGYNYSWEDPVVDLGFKYWYYVAAYRDSTAGTINLGSNYSGTNPATTTNLESSNVNRNGASGLWADTYPFAETNAFFPKTAAGQKLMGAAFVVKSALANAADLVSGATKVSVKPNPYKKKALFDNAVNAFDHKVTFYNLPGQAKITILDVSGQIVKQIDFSSTDPNNGSVFWDLFSKDGIEVASGLYIYVVDYQGGQQVGYLSILR